MVVLKLGLNECDVPRSKKLPMFFWFKVLQTPWYFCKWLFGILRTLYVLLFLIKEPTEEDVVLLIENTVLVLLTKTTAAHHERTIDIRCCRLRFQNGGLGKKPQEMRTLEVVYTVGGVAGGPAVTLFKMNGRTIKSAQQMVAILVQYHTVSLHTKSHLFSNSLVKHIVTHEIVELYDCTYGSVPLHKALTQSIVSTLQTRERFPFLMIHNDAVHESVIYDESSNMTALIGHQQAFPDVIAERVKAATLRRDSKYEVQGVPTTSKCRLQPGLDLLVFLRDARHAVHRALHSQGVDTSLHEAIFNHTVLHAVDHYTFYTAVNRLHFSLDPFSSAAEASFLAAFRCQMFLYLFVKPTLNPLFNNKVKHSRAPFFVELNAALQEINPLLADQITCSVMY